jgi:hypothetical protein
MDAHLRHHPGTVNLDRLFDYSKGISCLFVQVSRDDVFENIMLAVT